MPSGSISELSHIICSSGGIRAYRLEKPYATIKITMTPIRTDYTVEIVLTLILVLLAIGGPIVWLVRKNKKKQLVGREGTKAVLIMTACMLLAGIPVVFFVQSMPSQQDKLIAALTNEYMGDAKLAVTAGVVPEVNEIEEQAKADGVTGFVRVDSHNNNNPVLRERGVSDRYYSYRAAGAEDRYLIMRVEVDSLGQLSAPGAYGITEVFYGDQTTAQSFIDKQGIMLRL